MTEWEIEFYEDKNGKRPVEKWIESLDDTKLASIDLAHRLLLKEKGTDLLNSNWFKSVGDGVYEFRIRHTAQQIENLYKQKTAKEVVPKSPIILREFVAFRKDKVILLLAAYDKGKDPSAKTQQKQITLAKKRLKDWVQRGN